jgi:hypothetical protein
MVFILVSPGCGLECLIAANAPSDDDEEVSVFVAQTSGHEIALVTAPLGDPFAQPITQVIVTEPFHHPFAKLVAQLAAMFVHLAVASVAEQLPDQFAPFRAVVQPLHQAFA